MLLQPTGILEALAKLQMGRKIGMKLKWFYSGFYTSSGWKYEKCHCFSPKRLDGCCKQAMERRCWGESLSGVSTSSGSELGSMTSGSHVRWFIAPSSSPNLSKHWLILPLVWTKGQLWVMSGAQKEPHEPSGPAWGWARFVLTAQQHVVRYFPTRLLRLPPLVAAKPTHVVQSCVLITPPVPHRTSKPKTPAATSAVLQYTFAVWHQLVAGW